MDRNINILDGKTVENKGKLILINVIPFKIVPLDSFTLMETLFPLLIAALEVFNLYGLQQVFWMFSKVPK